ncbi:MAG: glycosyltransferase family 39 protein [Candidatus Korobacteraceae bacterium]
MEPSHSASRYGYYGLLLLVIVFFAALRWHMRNCPLERDEGEYAYAAQLMLHGVAPYQSLYTMKLPGTFAGYALFFAIFGQSIAGVHLGLLVINAATTLLIFLLGKRLFGPMAGIVSAASYALLSTSPSVIGFAGHATHFVVLPAVAGVLVLSSAIERQRSWLYFSSGVLFGLAFLMKQPGILFAVFGAVYLAYGEWQISSRNWRSLLTKEIVYAGGVALPFALTCIAMVATGSFGKFWFWIFTYAREYATTIGIGDGLDLLQMMLPKVVLPAFWIWVLAGVGLTAIAWNRVAHERRFFLVAFLFFSGLAVCPGLYFRQHYFVLVLPAAALLAGVAVSGMSERIRQRNPATALWLLPMAIFLAAFANALYLQREYLFAGNPLAACQTIYGSNPFAEAVEVAGYIKSHATPGARIAVLGSEPEIFFYSGHPSATGYIYTYGLMEPQPYALEMQKQMISEIEAAQPEYIVFVSVPESFGRLSTSNPHIFNWMNYYLPAQYDIVGVADMVTPTMYVWGDEAKDYRPRSPSFLRVFKRKAF